MPIAKSIAAMEREIERLKEATRGHIARAAADEIRIAELTAEAAEWARKLLAVGTAARMGTPILCAVCDNNVAVGVWDRGPLCVLCRDAPS